LLLVVLTDLGSITAHMLANLAGCDALVLECNHDVDMLAASRYPPSLKSRIGGRFGHLSNRAASDIVGQAIGSGLRHLVAAHLSRENNTPELARGALATRWGSAPRDVVVADPMLGFPWLQIG
jgi:phosphoribosyl 1,2-cyclic phosphodiesterase